MTRTRLPAGRIAVGHPVDVASGQQFTAAHDVAIGGTVPLIWRRYYSTALLDRTPGSLGRGWIHGFEARLVRDDAGFVFLGHDGLSVEFDDPAHSVDHGANVFHFGAAMELRREGAHYAIYHWHGWEEDVHKFMFPCGPAEMPLGALQLPSGAAVALVYNQQGRLTELYQSIEGRRLLLDYGPTGLLAALSLAAPSAAPHRVVEYEYDALRRLIAARTAAGRTLYGYDGPGRLISETDPAGGEYRMRYDSLGRCIETGGRDQWMHRTLEYDKRLHETSVTNSLGQTTVYEYNTHGQVETVRLPTGAKEHTDFDEFGRVARRAGPSGEMVVYGYGPRGDLTQITYPNGGSVKFEFNPDHQPLTITEPDGGAWRFKYDRGALVEYADPVGAATRFERDFVNQIVQIHTAAGNRIRLSRDADYAELRCDDDYGLLARYRFNEWLDPTEVHDARGLLRAFQYDPARRLTAITEADGTIKRVQHNALGLPVRYEEGNGSALVCDYDAYGCYRRIVNPNGEAYEYAWDTEGRLRSIRNPNGEREEYDYDAMGNLILRRSFGGRTERYDFDASGRCVRRHKADGSVLAYEFDQGGNAVRVSSGGVELAANTFDLLHRLLSTTTPHAAVQFEYDRAGQVLAETQGDWHVQSLRHPFGETSRRQFLEGKSGPIFLDYDGRRRLTGIRDEHRTLVSFDYDAANLLTFRQLGPVAETWEYNGGRRPSRQTVSRPHGPPMVREYTYDHRGYRLRVIDSQFGETRYAYDAVGRLTQSKTAPAGGMANYRYDACGNLLAGPNGMPLTYAPGNQLVQHGPVTQSRDANGNLVAATVDGQTTHYSWNAFDQLVSVRHPDGSETAFGYDGLGRRVWKKHAGVETRFVWSRRDLLAEVTEGRCTEYFIGNFQPQLAWDQGQLRYFILSPTSQPTELFDAEGVLLWRGKFDDWGVPLGDQPPAPIALFGLAAQYWDKETRLFYNQFRYYRPEDGRFISPDPIRTRGGLNEFLYGLNPINWLDPLGLSCGLTHMIVVVNPNLKGRGGDPDPTMADWQQKQDAFNNGVQQGINNGTPLTIPTQGQYQNDRTVGNNEARQARVAQGMGPGVQADHPVDLSCGGGQGQALYPLAGGVNGSFGSQLGPQAAALGPGSQTPKVDLYDQNGNLLRKG